MKKRNILNRSSHKENCDDHSRLQKWIYLIYWGKLSLVVVFMLIILIELGIAHICLDRAFIPSAFMGDYDDIKYNGSYKIGCKTDTNCMERGSCIRISYSALETNNFGWAGIYWYYHKYVNNPGDQWGALPGLDLRENHKLTFWARGERGGEIAQFEVGGITNDSTGAVKIGPLELTASWKQYTIDLYDRDLKNINGGFCWVTNSTLNKQGCIIYLSDIQYE